MSRIYMLLAALALVLLCACAGVEPSVMDTAETLGKGRFSVSNTMTMGLNLPEWQRMDPENIFDGDTIMPASYWETQVGVRPDADLALRLAATDEMQGAKMLFKKQIAKQEKTSSAFVAALGVGKMKPRYFDADEWDSHSAVRYELLTGEAHLLNTRKLSKDFLLTLALRGSIHQLNTSYNDGDTEQDIIYHAGVRGNIRWYLLGPFYLVWELGGEYPLSIEGARGIYPWTGFRWGMEF
ncbi:MAG: hypothetical protein PHC50_10800 [Candidatus Cloacimonetes bacterium]|nr:hypothetical protein [Candidatus Cloacimonadota bacterium]